MNRSVILFSILVVIAASIAYLTNTYILTDDAYFYYFQNQVGGDKIEDILQLRRDWLWLGYLVIPVIYLVKITIVTFCLLTGVFLWGYSIRFKSLFFVCLKAEFIYLIPPAITFIYFGVIHYNSSLKDMENFYPLALINFFDMESIPSWSKYSLSLINVFELLYVIILSIGLSEELSKTFTHSLKLVVVSYGSGLLLWVLTVMFIAVSFSS
jgi:hypothetical protein